jgi:DNA-binding response OmpR family regulator
VPGKVLIIDDDRAIATGLAVRLKAAGYVSVHASDGESGLAAAESDRPDVILLDIRMPDMDGFEVNRRLKGVAELADIPVIFLSANVQDWARRKAFDMGAKLYLSKPYDPERLLSAIETAISGAR